MPSSRAPDDETDLPDGDVSEAHAPVQTHACSNCGRTFVGDYCPECGQKAGQELSTAEVIGGFFREFVDVERGFWATLKALTIRPGPALRTYLGGAHARLMSPGRYLLAAVVLCYGVDRVLTWGGARASLTDQMPGRVPEDAAPVVREVQMVAWRVFESQGARVAANLLLAGLLALVLWRLFRENLNRGAEALALGGFLVGHTVLIEAVVKLVYAPAVYLSTGRPAEFSFLLYLGVSGVYIGWATYGCFGPDWRSAAKGLLGLGWSFVDLAALLAIAPLGYGIWLTQVKPQTYSGPEGVVLGFLFTAALLAVPLLVHAGVEVYYRCR